MSAIESYRRAIDYSPANDDAHRALGSVLDKLERVDEPKPPTRGRSSSPRLLGRLRAYRAVLQPAQRLPEGRRLLRKALMLSDNARVLFSLGLVFTNKGQYDRGIEFLERAIQLRPYLAPPYNNLGSISGPDVITTPWSHWKGPFRSSELPDSRQPGADLLADRTEGRGPAEIRVRSVTAKSGWMNPRDHGIHLLVGRYYAMLGRKSDSLRHLDVALLLHPGDAHYLTIAATCHVVLGDRAGR